MWVAVIGITIFLTLIYCVLILFYSAWFLRLKYFAPAESLKPLTRFSIIIPARNEEENIGKCINSILQNDYPQNLYEVIVVDDFSDDSTAGIIKKIQEQFFNLRLIELKNFVDTKLNS